jgi:hypothetical protein
MRSGIVGSNRRQRFGRRGAFCISESLHLHRRSDILMSIRRCNDLVEGFNRSPSWNGLPATAGV